ncbi:MAG TPA: hypothetical protein VJN18_32190 [Polyangiaceae bacterium]|nr:hypothetical protein [Polyangiaceae bacterium]
MTASVQPGDRDTLSPMPQSTEREILQHAKAAAEKRRPVKTPLAWSDALAEAPWGKGLSAAWETAYRRAYATALVKRGLAQPAARTGRTSGPSGESKLPRRTLRASAAEFAEQDRQAKAAGLPWATWVRRKLSSP